MFIALLIGVITSEFGFLKTLDPLDRLDLSNNHTSRAVFGYYPTAPIVNPLTRIQVNDIQ